MCLHLLGQNGTQLQKAQNLLARVTTRSLRSFQSSSYTLLRHLHWLPIKHRINFKITNITFCTLRSSQLVYLWSGQSCKLIILLVLSGSQTPIYSVLHSFALHLVPGVTALQLLKFGALSLQLFECVPVMTLSVINSKAILPAGLPTHLVLSLLAPQIRLWLIIVLIYKLYLLTYISQRTFQNLDYSN